MFKKLISLTSFIVVLALSGSVSADLVAHWSFDNAVTDAVGSLDWTSNGGAAFSTDAKEGSHSLSLNGTGAYLSQTAVGPLLVEFSTKTVALWFKADSAAGTGVIYDEGGTTRGMTIRVNDGNCEAAVRDASSQVTVSSSFDPGMWTHVGVSFDNGVLKLYLHGLEQSSATAGFTSSTEHSNAAGLGARNGQDAFGGTSTGDYFGGLIDDVRIYDNVLSASEIASMSGGYPKAYGPTPNDGAIYENTWASLDWKAGTFAVSHDVYIGESFDDVNNGAEGTFAGNITATSQVVGFFGFPVPDGLQPGTTYYWRVDEVNDADPNSPWKGDVWSFSVPPKTAYNSEPADGLKFVIPDVTLSWTAGLGAMLHNVYFGNNFDDVNNASGAPPTPDPIFTPGALESGVEYFWRVDEFDGAATHKGEVWSFTTIPPIAVGDPSLVGWWKFDEGMGRTVVDHSGYGHHGTIAGDVFWADGYDRGAMDFTGAGSYVEMTGYEGVTGTNPRTMTAWIKTSTTDGTILAWGVNTAGQKWRMRSDATGGLRAEVNGGHNYGGTNIADGRWHHVAVTWEDDGTPDALDFLLYVDGQRDATVDSVDEPIDTSAAGVVRIAESAWVDTAFVGLIDEVRIYDKVLTLEEIQLVMRINPQLAWAPSPAEETLAPMNVADTLSWSAGDGVSQYDVYFGSDQAAVVAADDTDTTGIYRSRQSATSYPLPEGVDPNSGPFYWRVDSVANDGTIVTGRLWSFSVTDYALIDDFETYNDITAGEPGSNLVYVTWVDGYENPNINGSTIGYVTGASMEPNNVHSGLQSAPFQYNNITVGVSEVTRTFTPARNWTINGLQTLSLWFAGKGTNAPGQLYVKVNGVQVNYDGNVNNLKRGPWQAWNIDLTSIGTNLTSVTSMAIGVQGPGATGLLLLDDIRLYPFPGELITPVQPDPAGLVAKYTFDGDANDSSGNGLHGILMGGPTFVLGNSGQAISFDGVDDYVEITGYKGILGPNAVTVTAWVKTTSTATANTGIDSTNAIIGWGPNTAGLRFGFRVDDGRLRTEHHGGNIQGNSLVADGQWHHVAVTVQANSTVSYPQVRLWLDGLDDTRPGTDPDAYNITADLDVSIGRRPASNDRFFMGQIDDVRIYNRALSAEEIAGMAGILEPYDKPF